MQVGELRETAWSQLCGSIQLHGARALETVHNEFKSGHSIKELKKTVGYFQPHKVQIT